MKKGELFFKYLIKAVLLCMIGLKVGLADEIELEQIVITPHRIEEKAQESGRRVNLISAEDLRYGYSEGASGALSGLSSVNIRDYGALGALKTIQMRGATASQVLIMMDGRPINSPRSSDVDLNTLPLENIERIETMSGPASSLYGSSAMGGVVNIVTKKPPKEKMKAEAFSSFGTYRTYIESLTQGSRIGKFGYILTADYKSSEGHRDHSEYDAKNTSHKLEYEFSDENRITLNSGFHRSVLETPGAVTSLDLDDYQKKSQNFLDFNWDLKTIENLGILLKIYQNYDRLEFIETPLPLNKTTHTTKSRALDIQFSQRLSDLYNLLYGFNYIGNFNDSTQTAKHEYAVRAFYLENRFELFNRIRLNLGTRIDDYSNFGTEINPSLNLEYDFDKNNNLYFLIARAFRSPTFNDLYWPSGGGAEGNPNLRPEKGITAEIGIRNSLSKYLNTQITYFRSDYADLIKWTEDSDSVWRPKNFDSALMQGVEFENKSTLTDNLDLKIGLTYSRAKDKKSDKFLTYQPKYKVNFSLIHKDVGGFKMGLRFQFVDRAFHNTANTIYLKRYYTLGADISKKIKNSTIFISVDNILDRKYQINRGYPMPGFSLTGGLKLEF